MSTESIIEKIQTNVISLNAMECVNPTLEFKIKLADIILKMLNDSENLLQSSVIKGDVSEAEKNRGFIPVLYLNDYPFKSGIS